MSLSYQNFKDGSDEDCPRYDCPSQSFQCDDGFCITKAKKCDTTIDCPDGSDEKYCEEHNCSSKDSFKCSNGQCLPSYTFCNSIRDCEDGSDENPNVCDSKSGRCPDFAFQCKKNKKCKSTAILCSSVGGCQDYEDELFCSSCYCDKPNSF